MSPQPHCLTIDAYPTYQAKQRLSLDKHLNHLRKRLATTDVLPFLIASAVHSCQIESNPLTLSAYYHGRNTHQPNLGAATQIDNMLEAYQYARANPLTEQNMLSAHRYLMGSSAHGGQYRNRDASVQNLITGQLVYQAASPAILKLEMAKLLADVGKLAQLRLSPEEIFYYASLLHLWVAQIHPFADGNGRLARLAESWFLAHHLGDVAWLIQSAHAYYRRRASYYQRLNLGSAYGPLAGKEYVPFLLLLPWSLREKVSWVMNGDSTWQD